MPLILIYINILNFNNKVLFAKIIKMVLFLFIQMIKY